MEKNITVRIFKIISIILILIAVVSIAFIWTRSETEMKENLTLQSRILNPYFITAYIALGLCTVLALLFPIINIITQPKNAVRALIGLGGLVLIGIIAYVLSSNEFSVMKLAEYNLSEAGSKLIGAAIIATYIIAGASIIAVLYAELSNLFKN